MGLDYIRSATGKPWRKRWAGGLDRLKQPSLLDLAITESARMVTAQLTIGCQPKLGDVFIIEANGAVFTVSDGLRSIGSVTNPSAEAASAGAAAACYAEAVVQRLGLFGDTAELSLR
jgi:hypothetical protein